MDKNFENKYDHHFSEIINFVMEKGVKNLGIQGIKTGYTDLDKLTDGFQPAGLTILAGRPAMGKTSFWINAVRHIIADSEMKVGVFLAKEEAEKVANTFLASESHVDIEHIESGRLSEDELTQIEKSAVRFRGADIYINTAMSLYDGIEFHELYHGILQHALTYCVDIIIIDSLQNISLDSACSGDKYIEIVKTLRELAITCQIPIVLISNLPAEIDKRKNKRPTRDDLREFGYIDNYADTVMFLYKDDIYNRNSKKRGIAELTVSGNIVGGKGKVELLWIPPFMVFANLEK